MALLLPCALASHPGVDNPAIFNEAGVEIQGAYGSATAQGHSPSYRCCTQQTLRLGLPPLSLLPFMQVQDGCDFGQACTYTGGMIVELWSLVTSELGAAGVVTGDWGYAVGMSQGLPLGPRSASCLETGMCDAIIFDYAEYTNYLNDGFDTTRYVVTTPFWFDSWTGIVLQTRAQDSISGALEPFANSLWVAVAIFIAAAACWLVALAVLTSAAARPRRARDVPAALCESLYHAASACLGGDHDYIWPSWAARLARLGLLVVILVLQATYTANLAAIFTRPAFETHGPKSMEELRSSIACVSYPGLAGYVAPHVRRMVTPPGSTNADGSATYSDADYNAWCHERLLDRTVDVWIDLETRARPIVLANCAGGASTTSLDLVSAIRFSPGTIGFALRAGDNATANHLSVAINYKIQMAPREYLELARKYYRDGQTCPPVNVAALSRVEFLPLAGVFAAFGVLAVLSLAMACAQRCSRSAAGRVTPSQNDAVGVAAPGVAAAVECWDDLDDVDRMTDRNVLRSLLTRLHGVERQLRNANGPDRQMAVHVKP